MIQYNVSDAEVTTKGRVTHRSAAETATACLASNAKGFGAAYGSGGHAEGLEGWGGGHAAGA